MSNIRRIGLLAGPGTGKSTTAAKLFAELKILGYDVEHIPEFVKTMAHEGRFPTSFDQVYIFGQQIHKEDIVLRHVTNLVTDCPIIMCCAYAKYYGSAGHESLLEIAHEFERQFPSFNLLLERDVPYVEKGRYQNSQQANDFDKFLLDFMVLNHQPFERVSVKNFPEMVKKIQDRI